MQATVPVRNEVEEDAALYVARALGTTAAQRERTCSEANTVQRITNVGGARQRPTSP